jgi:hypothetical protein
VGLAVPKGEAEGRRPGRAGNKKSEKSEKRGSKALLEFSGKNEATVGQVPKGGAIVGLERRPGKMKRVSRF